MSGRVAMTEAPDDRAGAAGAAAILRRLAAGPDASVPVAAIVAAAGSRIHGLALLVFVLPETLPLPLPSASSILGIPLVLISAHLMLFGDRGRLPARVERMRVPRSAIATLVRYAAPVLDRLERLTRPRAEAIAARERLIGLVCLYLSVILLLPLPLVNAPPAICLALVALGMIQRDGVLVAIGFIATAVLTAVLAAFAILAGRLF
jgi:hypothetical protein